MPDINLLNARSEPTFDSVSGGILPKIIARVLLVILILVVIAYVGLFVVNYTTAKSIESTNQQTKSLQTQALANKDRNELVTRQEQLNQVSGLIDKHVYWSYFLPELARVTLKSAKFTSITAKSSGKLNLSIIVPSYADVEKFLQIFDLPEYNQQFSDVKIVGINSATSGSDLETKLQLELTFNPGLIQGKDK